MATETALQTHETRQERGESIRILNYIDGELQAPLGGAYIPNTGPATGEVIGSIPDSDAADVDAAVQAAQRAFPAWSRMSPTDRSALLHRIGELILKHHDELARLEVLDSGKTITQAGNIEIRRAAQNFTFYAAAALHFSSESHYLNGDSLNYTLRQPVGVVACISPWNLPLYLFTWKIVPALAAGCCVVAKPSEVTPLTAYRLSEICREAGLPPGVLNIVHGTGARVGNALSAHPGIRAISFTGSTATGRTIAALAAPLFKKLSFELGGKNPVLVFADCNWKRMMDTTVRSSFQNQGQICLCGSRILIERSVYDRFKAEFVERARALRVGDPMDPKTDVGAIVSEAQFEKIMFYIRLAREEGGQVLVGGEAVTLDGALSGGRYIAPTVIEGLSATCRTNLEEIFGPVVTLLPFDTEEEALAMANGVEYGLASMVWTENLSRTLRLGHHLQSGIIWVNDWMKRDLRTPFGGKKNSGVGQEGGWESMRFFTEAKNVSVTFEH
jgi:aminomuconate-semialdehyde/2-hydroxymuconate-6-semialdehyde dehydrogenase